ncbi:LACX protein [Clostridia bacterium]|nr:LACX protein [Clostridia bacterium]
MNLVTISNKDISVTISTIGAELQSIRDKDGVERLWQGDPAWWSGRAPILFPVAGGLIEDSYILDGQRYFMPKHGFVRQLDWSVEDVAADSATFMVNAKDPGFPFDYELRARYTVSGGALKVEYIVSNTGDRVFWYGIGAHEAYSTPEGIEDYEIVFDEEERLASFPLKGNFILHEAVTMFEHTKVLPLKYDDFAVDALVFAQLKSHGVTLRSRSHPRTVRVEFTPIHEVLMFWTKPGAPYICIEPWTNAPDFIDHDMQISHKPGCMYLDPGASQTITHTITVG